MRKHYHETLPTRILLWTIGIIILLAICSPSCKVSIHTGPSVHDDANSVEITECEFGTFQDTPKYRILIAPDGTTIGVIHKW